MLFRVYDDAKPDGYYVNEPTGFYRVMLDADWVMYILLPGMLVALVLALMYAWRLHEIPKHKAQSKKMRQAELVSALTLLGLFEHWVWAVALFIAYMDWEAVENWVVDIVHRSRLIPNALGNAPATEGALVEQTPPAEPELKVDSPTPEEVGMREGNQSTEPNV